MVAPSTTPLINSVPLYAQKYILGQVLNPQSPMRITPYNVLIPSVLVGNEAKAGYAAFTSDGIYVTRGDAFSTEENFVGFFAVQYSQEADPGTNPWTTTEGSAYRTPILKMGSMFCYNGTAISLDPAAGLKVVIEITGAVSAGIEIGCFVQGTPANTTLLDISPTARVRSATTTVGEGFIVDLITP